MHRMSLDAAPAAVKKFIQGLVVEPDGVEIELNGKVVCKVVGPHDLSESERDTLLQDGLKLLQKAQHRSKGVPAKVIEREVRDAVAEVRRRKR